MWHLIVMVFSLVFAAAAGLLVVEAISQKNLKEVFQLSVICGFLACIFCSALINLIILLVHVRV